MRLRIPKALLLLLCTSLSVLLVSQAHGQSAEDIFHGGAQCYISNNIPEALNLVENGLKQYPNDVKLKKLEELLKQQNQNQNQNQQQNQDQKNQGQKNQQSQDQNKQGQNQQNKSQADQQRQKDQQQAQKNQSGQKDKPEQGKDKNAPNEKAGQDKDQSGGQAQGTPVEAKPMTPEEAKRLLDGEKGNEKVLMFQPMSKQKAEDSTSPKKDW